MVREISAYNALFRIGVYVNLGRCYIHNKFLAAKWYRQRRFSYLVFLIIFHYCTLPPGYDLIIDGDLKPWLLEVNASPSLSANTKEDYSMKCEMLNGMLDVVDMEQVLRGDEEHVSGECSLCVV